MIASKRTRFNLHTHTYRCKHADGDVADYCAQALRDGLSVLGMSDHVPLPDDRWIEYRMAYNERDAYMASIDNARVSFPELLILKSYECEYAPEYDAYYQDLLQSGSCDYLIGAVHFFPHNGEWISPFDDMYVADQHQRRAIVRSFTDYMIASMNSGLFLFMAHPDNFGRSYGDWDDIIAASAAEILQAAADMQMPLEINGYGLRKPFVCTQTGIERCPYPVNEFWEMASNYDIQVVVNSDAHSPRDVYANVDQALKLAERYGLHVLSIEELLPKIDARANQTRTNKDRHPL